METVSDACVSTALNYNVEIINRASAAVKLRPFPLHRLYIPAPL